MLRSFRLHLDINIIDMKYLIFWDILNLMFRKYVWKQNLENYYSSKLIWNTKFMNFKFIEFTMTSEIKIYSLSF